MTGDERRGPDGTESGSDDADAPADLDALSYRELQSLAADHGVSPVGHGADDLRELLADVRESGEANDEDANSEETDVENTDDEESEDGDGREPTEIPTVGPEADRDGGDGGEADSTSGSADAADADTGGDGDEDAADGDDATEDDAADDDGEGEDVPDWVTADEPTVDEVLGPDESADDGERIDEDSEADESSPAHEDSEADDDPEAADDLVHASEAESLAQSDGGATVVGGTDESDADYDYYDEEFIEGPESDQEMPLADHIEEMVRRLGVVIIAMAAVSVVTLPFAVDLIDFIWYSILGSVQTSVTSPRAYQPLALVLARLKVATLAGFVVALPVFVYETYLFMRPGLYKHERRYYLAAVPTSLVLACIGVAFAFYLVLPFIFSYFVSYSEQAADIAFGLTETFGLMLLLMGFFAAVFQIPLLIMLAVMMGLTTREWLVARRLYFWGGFLGVALLFSPDPTGMAPFIVAITMVTLFEGTLLLLRWTRR